MLVHKNFTIIFPIIAIAIVGSVFFGSEVFSQEDCHIPNCSIIEVDGKKYKVTGEANQELINLNNFKRPLHAVEIRAQFLEDGIPFHVKIEGNADEVDNIAKNYLVNVTKTNIYPHNSEFKSIYGTVDKVALTKFLSAYDYNDLQIKNVRVAPLGQYTVDDIIYESNFLTDEQLDFIKNERETYLKNELRGIITEKQGVAKLNEQQ